MPQNPAQKSLNKVCAAAAAFFFSREAVKTSPNLAHEMAGQTMAKCIFGQQKTKNGERGVCLHCRKQLAIMSCLHFLMGWHERNPREIDNIRSKKNNRINAKLRVAAHYRAVISHNESYFPKRPQSDLFPNKNIRNPRFKNNPKLLLCLFPLSPRGIFAGKSLVVAGSAFLTVDNCV